MIGFFAAGLLVFLKKFGNKVYFEYIVKFLFAFACGALLGDVFIHTLPDAYWKYSMDPIMVSVTLVLSILFFVVMERVFHASGIGHSHSHSHGSVEKS